MADEASAKQRVAHRVPLPQGEKSITVCSMARDDPMMRFRAPEQLKHLIEQSSASNGRTMNAEIVHRLERSFAQEVSPWAARDRIDNLDLQLFQAEAKLKWLVEKWDNRIKDQKPLGNLESILYEVDIRSAEDTIIYLKNKINDLKNIAE
ncbi:Arc family DNA-binding protein [Acetobacter sacchari]|uniref:Arc family DNA-binding protein n=1 Tax=Acetobacter sacchari TaxID=2661687 RepID=A0ABS3LXH7_9PROT|nr:Arc family DNA-binding protein [Acetobacter sacchari]MBO1360620.1 Arc family DNA-binding protein [Acetobacter sacchari]